MSYTIVGLFRTREDAETAKSELETAGFDADKVDYSPYKSEGEYAENNYEYKEDEKSQGFWDWLFGDDTDETIRYEKERYSRLGSRSFVLTAHADDRDAAERARDIMDNSNAIDADEYERTLAEYNERYRDNHDDTKFNERIDVIREEMNVGKKEVETGGVSIRSRIVEKPVEESVRLRDERVYVKRNKVDREATDADFRPGSISMREYEERPVVTKEARVVEEIELGKDVEQKERVVQDTVRETEVDIDTEGTAKETSRA